MNEQNFKSGIVAMIGPPNAGKSTLLNSLVGQKISIVTPKPQTTRNRISGILSLSHAQIVFLDTPGVHNSNKVLNKFLVENAWKALNGADLILLVLDGSKYVNKPSRLHPELTYLQNILQAASLPKIIALNKEDLCKDKKTLLPVIEEIQRICPEGESYPISALLGRGTSELLQRITELLPYGPPLHPEDQVSTVPLRFMAAEIIREKLFLSLQQELPYSVAVNIESWEEQTEKNLVLINGLIYVAKKNHKQIVIGKKGTRLKKIGSQARLELEEILGRRVHLQLWVKVQSKWNEDLQFLHRLEQEITLGWS